MNLSKEKIAEQYDKQGQLFDGQVKQRFKEIVQTLIQRETAIRPVRKEDAKLIFDWANDPVVRQNAINREEILWDDGAAATRACLPIVAIWFHWHFLHSWCTKRKL